MQEEGSQTSHLVNPLLVHVMLRPPPTGEAGLQRTNSRHLHVTNLYTLHCIPRMSLHCQNSSCAHTQHYCTTPHIPTLYTCMLHLYFTLTSHSLTLSLSHLHLTLTSHPLTLTSFLPSHSLTSHPLTFSLSHPHLIPYPLTL